MTRNRLRQFAVLAALAASPFSVQAQGFQPQAGDQITIVPTAPDEIVVTALPDEDRQTLDRQARAISHLTGSGLLHEPLARFQAPVCPGVIGLPRQLAELMVYRIRFNAQRVGMSVAAEDGCEPNIIVAFIKDGQATVERLAQTRSHIFSELTRAERLELLAETGPVRVWTNTAVRSRQGDSLRGRRDHVEVPVVNVANTHSHIFLAHRIDIESAVVVFDGPALSGLSINQLADYATMRSFARTRAPEGQAPAETILTLFSADEERAAGLTPFDLAYLTGLYRAYDSQRAATTLAQTGKVIRRAMAAGDATIAAD